MSKNFPYLKHQIEWEKKFSPKKYLNEYYYDVNNENVWALSCLIDSYRDADNIKNLLDFGAGPTVYQLIVASKYVDKIDCREYLTSNRDELIRWIDDTKDAFDWSEFTSKIIELETGKKPTQAEIRLREDLTRKKIRSVEFGDARNIGIDVGTYDCLSLQFLPDSITDSKQEFRSILSDLLKLLKVRGKLVMNTIIGASSYQVGSEAFPSASLTELDVVEVLSQSDFNLNNLNTSKISADHPEKGYSGMFFVSGIKENG